MTVAESDLSSSSVLKVLDSGSNNLKSGAMNPRGTIVLGVAAIVFPFCYCYKTNIFKAF
jgi:hypothetical protein